MTFQSLWVGKARKTLKSLVLIFYYLSNAKGLSQNGTAQNITLSVQK
jgi:hypothetical protein